MYKAPLILVLTSYEPVAWKVETPRGAVARVIASGYYTQTVEGLDGKVPVTLISYKAGDRDYFYAFRKEADAKAGEHRARRDEAAITAISGASQRANRAKDPRSSRRVCGILFQVP